jgi:exoribonuclease II
MNQVTAPCRDRLISIARRAMLERDLLPDFSAAVVDQTGSIAGAAPATDPSLRDLRRLPWASIDNDDSLDLDQLSVAEQLRGGTVKILVAVADVDAIVRKGGRL